MTPTDAGLPNKRSRLPGLTVKGGLTLHPFDLEFGTRTSGLVAGRHLKTGHRHDRHMTAYFGVAPSVFQSLVSRWRKSTPAASIRQTTFVDLGAGMGRAVLLASQLSFKAAVGVELHPALCRIARRNRTLWKATGREKSPIHFVHADAVEFILPPGPIVAFLFNPFGAAVLRRLLKSWRKVARLPGALDLLYVNNEQEAVLECERGWQRLFLGKVRRSQPDAIADHAIMANQPEGEYAASNWEVCSIWRWNGERSRVFASDPQRSHPHSNRRPPDELH